MHLQPSTTDFNREHIARRFTNGPDAGIKSYGEVARARTSAPAAPTGRLRSPQMRRQQSWSGPKVSMIASGAGSCLASVIVSSVWAASPPVGALLLCQTVRDLRSACAGGSLVAEKELAYARCTIRIKTLVFLSHATTSFDRRTEANGQHLRQSGPTPSRGNVHPSAGGRSWRVRRCAPEAGARRCGYARLLPRGPNRQCSWRSVGRPRSRSVERNRSPVVTTSRQHWSWCRG